jgi:hypothetical protein
MKTNKLSPTTISCLIALALFLASLALNWSSFFPTLGEINPWDEAAYVKAGKDMLRGELPIFAGSPLTAAFYALTNLVFSASPFWLIRSVAAGRFVAYTLIWLSAYLIGKRLSPHTTPLILVGMLLAAPFYIKMLRFPSDPFFMAIAGLGLWQLLTFHQTRQIRYAALASTFIALAAATRNDGLVLFVVSFIWLFVVVMVKKLPWLTLAGFVVPFVLIVGGYVLLFGASTGNYSLGTAERTYDNFEAGQIAVYSGEEGVNAAVDAKREARRQFGTAEENDYSVVKAILRNPQMFLERVKRVSLGLPSQIIKAYSGKWVVLLAFWAVWGVVTLFQKRQWAIVSLLLVWFTPVLSGFVITIFRTGHLLFPSLVVLSFGAIGLLGFVKGCTDRKVYLPGLILMALLLLVGFIANEVVVIYATGLCLAAMLLIRLGQVVLPLLRGGVLFPLILFLLVGILLHGPYPGFSKSAAELPREEQALLAMVDSLPKGARILAGSPGVVYAADMTYLGLSSTDVPIFSSSYEFGQWLESQHVDAVYIDQSMIVDNLAYWKFLQDYKTMFSVTYSDQNGETQVWIRNNR